MDINPKQIVIVVFTILLSSTSFGLGVSEPLVKENDTPSSSPSTSHSWNRIEGKLIAPMEKKTNEWLVSTQILVILHCKYAQIF